MEMVYKKFGICDDIQYLIDKQIHIGYIKMINEDIETLIGFNSKFNYSCINNVILHINKKCVFRKHASNKYHYCCYSCSENKTKFYDLDNKNINYHTNKVKFILSKEQEITEYYNQYNRYYRVISKVIQFENYNLKVLNSYLEKNRLIHSSIIELKKDMNYNNYYNDDGKKYYKNLDKNVCNDRLMENDIETIEMIFCKSREEFYNIVYNEYENYDNIPNNFINVIQNNNFNQQTFLNIFKSQRWEKKRNEILEYYLNNDLHSRKKEYHSYFEQPHRLLHYNCYRKDDLIKLCNDNKLRGISRLNKNQLVNRLMKMEDDYKNANKNHKKRTIKN